MTDDAELLRRYTQENSEEAFAELVRRHVDFVYATALRRLGGDTHSAADVVQTVFIKLARQAGKLSNRAVLVGWLHAASRNAAVDVVRTENRRRAREHAVMEIRPDPETVEWERMKPALDAALDGLKEADREAVLLRFFRGRRFNDIAMLLGLSEDNARRRVDRALEKLRDQLARRGITSTAAALALALASQPVVAAPAGLAPAAAGAALASVATSGNLLALVGLTKLQWGMASAVLLAGVGAALLQDRDRQNLLRELAAIPVVRASDNVRLNQSIDEIAAVARAADALKVDDAEWVRLRGEALSLRLQLADKAREARARAERAARPIQIDQTPTWF